ncbi:heterokaryon incompatibility protein-domain-containing protein [Boeremia exigua]|uniref:heterokaryon incompatibility protein-domain-containing protein n=1 Tax=Boeremia exigua TaxID=749465 RepID=UPI001E8D2A53|nr:heterokaryon incompatibility protein-domain-containing protein [Boeremia exigua]KAH6613046.1 heterokaryon incompatibility protein-domain-containing protein [Boeremia exigua]
MPFHNVFVRYSDDDGRLTPGLPEPIKSSRSSRSFLSLRSLKSPKPLTYTERNDDRLQQCLGCFHVDDWIRLVARQSVDGEERPLSVKLHDSFAELDQCAVHCDICRLFRQALVLEDVTFSGVRALSATLGMVVVRWQEMEDVEGNRRVNLRVEIEGEPERSGVVNCDSQDCNTHLTLHADARDAAVADQAKQWLDTCLHDHIGACDNLSYSSESPDLMVQILSPDEIQLQRNHTAKYVALSYAWGRETQEVRRAKTLTTNLAPRCSAPFTIDGFPSTVRDAIRFVYAMGLRYIWIDSICIVQNTGLGVDAMHKVYSNALFTINACATTQAGDMLLDYRKAWDYPTKPCRLGGAWLTTTVMSLNELRLRSPLARRAWTLQEDRLSPRMLYISSTGVSKQPKPTYTASGRETLMPVAQEFLLACRNRPTDDYPDLYAFWADIIKSYAARDMSMLQDRFLALSGMASKYLSANSPDEYLAGIWANTLPEGLVWKVDQMLETLYIGADGTGPPSWSWMALPLRTAIETDARSARSEFFKRLIDEDAMSPIVPESVEEGNHRGAMVKELRVAGRRRELWSSSSRRIDWSSVSATINGEERFTFAQAPEQDLHAIHAASGRVLVYENRKKEIIG